MNTPYNQIRPSTAGLIELHVFYVPEELWNPKLNTVSTEAVNKFISAGFIRVAPDLKLHVLRERLGEFLIEDTVADKFLFLKSVGRSLAVVKAQQEQELKLKSFAPPYALQPELYLLPGVEHEGSVYASSLTPERQHYNAEYAGFCISPVRPGSLISPRQEPGGNLVLAASPKKIIFGQDKEETFPEIEIVGVLNIRQNPGFDQTKEIQETHGPQRRNLGHYKTSEVQEMHNPFGKDLEQDLTKQAQKTHSPPKKNLGENQNKKAQEKNSPPKKNLRENQNKEAQATYSPEKKNPGEKQAQDKNSPQKENLRENQKTQCSVRRKEEVPVVVSTNTTERSSLNDAKTLMGRNSTGDSGIPESLEDRDLEPSSHNQDSLEQTENKHILGQKEKQLDEREETLLRQSIHYLSPSPPPLLQTPTIQREKSKLTEQLEQMKEERKQLEKTREELGRKAKGLLEENKLRKSQARDAWKKKYFDTKKITMSLEETVNKLRQELELHYQKLLTQLEARDTKRRSCTPALAGDPKNTMIIQIVKQQYEIDQQKRELENAKMKLVKELKMRKQATSDLQGLRAELAQKKMQCSSQADALLLENV